MIKIKNCSKVQLSTKPKVIDTRDRKQLSLLTKAIYHYKP